MRHEAESVRLFLRIVDADALDVDDVHFSKARLKTSSKRYVVSQILNGEWMASGDLGAFGYASSNDSRHAVADCGFRPFG